MDSKSKYPALRVDITKLKHNVKKIVTDCEAQGVCVAGVVKGCSGLLPCIRAFDEEGCKFIASSRMEHIRRAKAAGIKKPLMLIRIPMHSEIEDVIALTEYSLNSELEILKELNKEAGKQGKIHNVILMIELGDLREGIFEDEEILEAVDFTEKAENLYLSGVGTNLGCYGSIVATKEKMEELVSKAELIEDYIGRTLDYVSGGASSSFTRIGEKDMPSKVNMLRIGEVILTGNVPNYEVPGVVRDAFTLRAQVVEIKDKPSYPMGEIGVDAFGMSQSYEDSGVRKRVLLAVGKGDYVFPEKLVPREEGVKVIGASSDHTIVDVEEAKRDIKVGDIMEFDVAYGNLVFLTDSSNINLEYVE